MEVYKDHYTVITYDARGTGQSTHPEDKTAYSMRILADDAAALQLRCTWGFSDEWFIRMIDSNKVAVDHDDLEMYIRLALLWVAGPQFINERPEDVEAFERGFIADNPHPPSKAGILGHFHADQTHDALDRLHSCLA